MTLLEYLRKNSIDLQSVVTKYLEQQPKDKGLFYNPIVEQEVLKVYNKENSIDFQKLLVEDISKNTTLQEQLHYELSEYDEIDLNNTLKAEQDNTNKEDKEIDRSIQEVTEKESDLDITDLDAEQKDAFKESLKEKVESGEEVTSNDAKAELRKAIYLSIYEKYYNLKQRLYYSKNGMVENKESYAGDKQEYELFLYRSYLQKMDLQYKGLTGKTIAQDDEEIREELQEKELRNIKTERNINFRQEKQVDKIRILMEKLQEISDEISYLALNSKLYTTEDYNNKSNELQRQYVECSNELDELNPNYLEIYNDLENRQQTDIFEDKINGSNYANTREKDLGIKRELDIQEKLENQNLNKLNISNIDMSENMDNNIENILEAIEQTNEIEILKEHLETLKSYADENYVRKAPEERTNKDKENRIEKDLEEEKRDENIDPIRAQCSNYVSDVDDEKTILVEYLKSECRKQAEIAKGKYKKIEEKSEQSLDNGIVRTRFNKKNY